MYIPLFGQVQTRTSYDSRSAECRVRAMRGQSGLPRRILGVFSRALTSRELYEELASYRLIGLMKDQRQMERGDRIHTSIVFVSAKDNN